MKRWERVLIWTLIFLGEIVVCLLFLYLVLWAMLKLGRP